MKIAIVEKNRSTRADPYAEYFNFKYDIFSLTNSNNTRILKKDVTLAPDFDEEYDYVILIGKEPCKHVGKINNVTKYAGQLINDKYIPMVNPVAVKFNPGLGTIVKDALDKIHNHINGTYKEVLGKYRGIYTEIEAQEYLKSILNSKQKYVVVDIETSSLYPRDGYILGIAMTNNEKEGVYIESDCINDDVEYLMQQIFHQKAIIFHNAKFDMAWLELHFGFKFNVWHDTMLLHYLLNENEPHDLKYLAIKYTKMGEYDSELEEFKRNYMKTHGILKMNFSYEYIPFKVIYKYAAADADATLRLFNIFYPIVKKHFNWLYKDIMLRGTKFLKDIENNGVPFSREYLEKANEKYTHDIFALTEDLYKFKEVREIEEEQGTKFNPNSTAQLRKLFFDKLNLDSNKKTAGGLPSTDKEVLNKLAEIHEIPKLILKIRGMVKIQSTYIVKVLKGLDSDSRLRAGFHLHTVTSGRLSSSGKLNMQQLPRDDKTVKSCIRPLNKEWVIFSQDLQTAEMYYAAVLSKDKNLAKVFRDGEDFHSSIAKLTFGLTCPVSEVKIKYPELRQASKAISFGILYGAGPGKVAMTAGISYDEAKNIIRKYFSQFRQLEAWIKRTQDEINSNGYIYSAFGRKRRVPNVTSVDDYEQGHALRSAMNFTIQSLASDVNLMIAMDSHDIFKNTNIRAEIFALVHDSIVGQCHKDDIESVRKILLKNTIKDRGVSIADCPIKVDFGYGESYAEAG